MTILHREADLYPADLLDTADPGQETSLGRWWALYTRARREKDLMRRLQSLDIAFYSPLVKRRTRSPAGRVRESFIPLFCSYVFLFGDHDQRRDALTTQCISRCLEIHDQAALTRDLRQIHRLITSETPLAPESRLEPGFRVRVRSGSLIGMEGVVLERRGERRLLVAVEFLQQGASVLLDDLDVEPA